MLKSHLDQIRLISVSKNMQHNDAISLLKIPLNDDDDVVRMKTPHKLDRRLIESHLVGTEVKDCRSDALEPCVVSSLPFKCMCEVCSAGRLQISEPGAISRKKHSLDLTGLRILLIHVTQISPKRTKALLLSYTYTIITQIHHL